MSTADKLLIDIEAFLKRHNMTPGRFGIDADLDHKFVSRLRAGKGCHSSSIDIARAFMSSYAGTKRQKKTNQPNMAA